MSELDQLKKEIKELEEEYYSRSSLDGDLRANIRARYNSKVRRYNRKKKFYQLGFKEL